MKDERKRAAHQCIWICPFKSAAGVYFTLIVKFVISMTNSYFVTFRVPKVKRSFQIDKRRSEWSGGKIHYILGSLNIKAYQNLTILQNVYKGKMTHVLKVVEEAGRPLKESSPLISLGFYWLVQILFKLILKAILKSIFNGTTLLNNCRWLI